MLQAKIFIRLKPNVLDPQGKAVSNSLHQLGYVKVVETRVSKYIEISFDDDNEQAVEEQVHLRRPACQSKHRKLHLYHRKDGDGLT